VCFAQEGTTNPSKENEWVVKGKSRRRLTGSSERWRRDPELKAVAAVAGDASEQESGRCVFGGERAYRDCWSTGAAGSGALSPESRAGGEGWGTGEAAGSRCLSPQLRASGEGNAGRRQDQERGYERRSVTRYLEASTHKHTREHFEPTINDRTVKKIRPTWIGSLAAFPCCFNNKEMQRWIMGCPLVLDCFETGSAVGGRS
jgi:hypothetical protein